MVDAGWFTDPTARHAHRYWDGARWTEHVAGPNGQGIDPLLPAPPPAQVVEQSAQPTIAPALHEGHAAAAADPASGAAAGTPAVTEPAPGATPGRIRTDPTELHAVLGELGIRPVPAGDGTLFSEPVLLLAWSDSRPDTLEWWTPDGVLVAAATRIEASDAEIEEHGVATDVASGAMVGTRMTVLEADGTPLVTTTRTLKPAKPPTFVDDLAGRRLASLQQEKIISRLPSHTITGSHGESLGRFDGFDSRGRVMVLSDPAGGRVATLLKHGNWEAANMVLESGRRTSVSIGDWLGDRVAEKLWPVRRERICSVLVLDRPLGQQQPLALLTVLSPLLLEHLMSLA